MKKQTEKCEDFKVGDVVQLKSGGPRMTVSNNHILDNESVWTSWFSVDNEVKSSLFLKSILKLG